MARPWRVAKSLDVLLAQVNALAPNRSKKSDGSIGDAKHRSRASDHNAWVTDGNMGVVTARDFTHDPKGGFDAYQFAETLKVSKDPRIKYVISNRRIFSGAGQKYPAWTWRKYYGTNPHDKHTHVSVKSGKVLYDLTTPWDLAVPVTTQPVPLPQPVETARPTLRRGSKGQEVRTLQELLKIKVDGDFGRKTEQAVRTFQAGSGLKVDGKVGKLTWAALLSPVAPGPVEKPIE